MRKANLCIVVAGCLLLATVTVLAGQRPDTNSDVIVSQPRNLPNPLNALYEKMLDELNLTADQQSRIKQILETHHQAMTNWRKQHAAELKSLREEIIEARKNKEAEKVKQLRTKIAEILKERRELTESLRKQIEEVLSDEQREKAREIFRHARAAGVSIRRITFALKKLDLTDEQEQKIKAILKDAREDAQKADTPKEKEKIWADAIEEIKKDVLTESQAKKFDRITRRVKIRRKIWHALASLKLTDDQRKKIAEIRKEYREKIAQVKPKERWALISKMHEEILSVLTDEQKEQLKEMREKFVKHVADILDLTDEQREQIKKIRDKYREKIANAKGEERRRLIKQMFQEIDSVLTDEQKAKIRKWREKHRRWRKRRPHPVRATVIEE